MLKIAICDDDMLFAEKVEQKICNLTKRLRVKTDIDLYADGKCIVKSIRDDGERYDLIYMDIEMKHMNGLKAAREIRKVDDAVTLIYLTGHEKYAKDLFEVRPFRFLLKPIREMEFRRCFKQAYQQILKTEVYFTYTQNRTQRKVLLRDVIYFECTGRQIHIEMVGGSDSFYGRLCDVEEKLSGTKMGFLKISRSHLVNYQYITGISYEELEVAEGRVFTISKRKRGEISRTYGKLLEKWAHV